jgi:hypothetical protein
MAFAVTAYKSYATPAYEAVTQQFTQTVEMTITRAAADAVLDIGNVGGTFWTSALTGAPALATAALANFKNVIGKARNILSVRIPEVTDTRTLIVSGSPATTQYKLATASLAGFRLDLFATDAAPATLTVALSVSLLANELPVPGLQV